MNTFGDRFKQLRVSRELTQDELVIQFNNIYNYKLTKSAISQYENNKRLPDIQIIKNFAAFFKVSIDYLLCSDMNYLHETPTAYISAKENIETLELSELFNITKDAIEFNNKITVDGKDLSKENKILLKNFLDIALELIRKNQ